MSYGYDGYQRKGGLGQRALTGTVIGAIPAIATGNPVWLGYGALGGTALGLLEGRNALGGGNLKGGSCWMADVGRPVSRRVYGGAHMQPYIIEGGHMPDMMNMIAGGRRRSMTRKTKKTRKSRSRKSRSRRARR